MTDAEKRLRGIDRVSIAYVNGFGPVPEDIQKDIRSMLFELERIRGLMRKALSGVDPMSLAAEHLKRGLFQ